MARVPDSIMDLFDRMSAKAPEGTDMKLHIRSGFMGATKQLPALIHEIHQLMPKVAIYIHCGEFHANDKGKNTLKNDLTRLDPNLLNNVRINPFFGENYDLRIAFHIMGEDIPHEDISLWVEPLKFEERPLLSPIEIAALREKYSLGDSRVIIAGAVHPEEIIPVYTAIALSQKNNPEQETVGLIVPRADPYYCAKLLKEHGIKHHTYDSSPPVRVSGKPRLTVIVENGILQDLYSVCDVAFVGDTLWTTPMEAGQNPLEPAFYGKKIVVGPNHTYNRRAFNGLRMSGLLVEVYNQIELNTEIATNFSSEELEKRVANADAFIKSQRGSAREYALMIKEALYGGA